MTSRPFRRLAALAAVLPTLLAAAPPPPAEPALSAESLAVLRGYDRRLATIAYRLATANVTLCDARAPVPGWALHAVDQYPADTRAVARRVFGFAASVAVEAVVPGTAAARAGIVENDALVAVAGTPLGAAGSGASSATRDAALTAVAAQPAAAPLPVTILHDGARRAVTIPASPGCATTFEILLGPAMTASADGRLVQIGVRFFDRYADDELAAIVAHELSHNILRHRVRLEAAGVKFGILAELGRNGRLFRRIEAEADQLSVSLLRNAGYDPAAAARFWREHGGEIDGGLFRSRTHPSSKARADAVEAEIARLPPASPTPYRPPLWATRNDPLN